MPVESMTGATANNIDASRMQEGVNVARKNALVGGIMGAGTGLAEAFAQKQVRDHLASLGLDPSLASDPHAAVSAILEKQRQDLSEKQAGLVQGAMQPGDTSGISDSFFAQGGAAPAAPATPNIGMEGVDAAPAPAPRAAGAPNVSMGGAPVTQSPKIGMEGIDTSGFMGTGPAPSASPYPPMTPPPAAAAPQPTGGDPRAAYFKRLGSVRGLDMEGLTHGAALGSTMFGAATDPTEQRLREAETRNYERESARDPVEEYRKKQEIDRANQVNDFAPRTPKATAARDRPLTAEHAQRMGFPAEWADGETTVGEAEDAASRQGIGKPAASTEKGEDQPLNPALKAQLVKTHPDVPPESFNTFREARAAGVTEGEMAQLARAIGVQQGQATAANYEDPQHKEIRDQAKTEYEALLAVAKDPRALSMYTVAHPKHTYEADLAAAKARLDHLTGELGTARPTGNAAGAAPAKPGAAEPAPKQFNDASADPNDWSDEKIKAELSKRKILPAAR